MNCADRGEPRLNHLCLVPTYLEKRRPFDFTQDNRAALRRSSGQAALQKNLAGFGARDAHERAAPGGRDSFTFLEQIGGDADLAAADEALVIFFELSWDI
jgi:hypothetical protein